MMPRSGTLYAVAGEVASYTDPLNCAGWELASPGELLWVTDCPSWRGFSRGGLELNWRQFIVIKEVLSYQVFRHVAAKWESFRKSR